MYQNGTTFKQKFRCFLPRTPFDVGGQGESDRRGRERMVWNGRARDEGEREL